MKKGEKFSAERLAHIRRLRKARRYFSKLPLFAYQMMLEELPGYTHAEFLDDLRRRTPKRKRKGKSPLARYGRYGRIEQLMAEYRLTGDPELAIRASRLRQRITTDYRVLVKIGGESTEYSFSPLIPIARIEGLVAELGRCATEDQAHELVERFRRYATLS